MPANNHTAQSERNTGIAVTPTGEGDGATFELLTNSMARAENGEIRLQGLNQPSVRAGLAFMMAAGLDTSLGDLNAALAAIEWVIPVITVNSSDGCACYITGGSPRLSTEFDLRTLGMVLEKNGHIAGMGAGAQVLDHPANAVLAAQKHLAQTGAPLAAGSLVVAAGITPAVEVAGGDNILVRVQYMGSVSLRLV